MSLAQELASLAHDAEVELYELDCTPVGGDVVYFHNGTNALNANVVWQSRVYVRFPIEASGFGQTGTGPMPRPKLRVSNVGGLVGVLVRQFRGLKGARLTRRRTLAKYLDAVNFPGGVNPSADPNTHYPDDVWVLDRMTQRDRTVVAYDLASPLDVAGVMLPRRQVIANGCWWLADGGYRGPNCGYTGPPVAKADDTPTTVLAEDVCGGRLSSCRLRQWPGGELPFGGFPGVGVLRNV